MERDRRGVVAVMRVSGTGRKKWAPLYRGIEGIEGPRLTKQLQEGYAEVVVRSGDDVTPDSVVADVQRLTANADLDRVDVILSTHGDPGEVIFARDDRVTAVELASRIASPKLRLLYDTACYGNTHAEPFLAAGFDAVVGAKAKNTNGWAEYHHLVRRWIAGDTIAEAVKAADRVVPRVFWDVVARIGGMREVDSEKVVSGDRALRISS